MATPVDSPITIQCSTGPFWAYELEQAMDALVESGFTRIELMVTRDPKTQDPGLALKLARERGLSISSVHGPFLAITKSVWGMDPLGKIRRGVEMCRELDADTLIVHPPYLWEGEYARWVDQECEGFSLESGVRVTVETMYPKWVAGRRVRAYRWLEPGALQHHAPYVTIDTSHLAVSRLDILDAFHVLAPKLVHVHLSDNAGDSRDAHLEVGKGVLPLERFLSELRRNNYRGAVSLELSVIRYLQQPRELVAMLTRSREFVEDRLTRKARMTKGLPRQ